MALKDRIKRSWNAFTGNEPSFTKTVEYGISNSRPLDRIRTLISKDKTNQNSIYTRLSIDVASVDIRHSRLGDDGRFVEEINSGLNECLNVEANIDQTGRAFRQDVAMSLFEHGVIAIVPVDTKMDPRNTSGFDILSLRVGTITQWYPNHIRVNLYNERSGRREEITLPKKMVAIVENPFYSVMNEPNSTLRRLQRKMDLLDIADEKQGSNRLDLIIQLPYVVKSDARKKQAEDRKKEIEAQLTQGGYGIAYTDHNEQIIQLNRPVENNLLPQIKELKAELFNQLGLTEEIFKGTASEAEMLNYYTRTIEPVVAVITDEMKRKFLSKTARAQKQSIEFFRDPFALVPVSSIADIADKLTRNEILSSNEFRAILGFQPREEPRADALQNKNMPEEAHEPPMDDEEYYEE